MALGVMINKLDMRYVGLAVATIVLIAGGIGGYRWYRLNKEQKAQEVFSSCIHEYERAEKDPSLWANTELVFRLALEQNQNTALTPSLLAYQAESLLRMNKPEQALDCMNKAVALLPTRSDLYNLYATKQALMMMDAADQAVKDNGLASLTTLAQDVKNSTRDMALYYLGLYHWAQDDAEKARTAWTELLPLADADPASPWAQRAAQKIEQLVAV